MNKAFSHPIEYILDYVDGDEYFVKHNPTVLNNARHELRSLHKKIEDLENKLSQYKSMGWVNVNNRGDYFNMTFHCNPFETQSVPLYTNKEELKKLLDRGR
jgi:hypothetical protein